jgi:hypothetical protein
MILSIARLEMSSRLSLSGDYDRLRRDSSFKDVGVYMGQEPP